MRVLELLLGRPLRSDEEAVERIGVLTAIPVLGLDALASASYGPEAALTVLLPLGATAAIWVRPITLAIVGVLAVVALSYAQTIPAYPNGGGSFTVAKENLGRKPGLLAAAALCTDYVLNVAVAISAGIGAIASAEPRLLPHTLPLCLGVLALLTIVNLRGAYFPEHWRGIQCTHAVGQHQLRRLPARLPAARARRIPPAGLRPPRAAARLLARHRRLAVSEGLREPRAGASAVQRMPRARRRMAIGRAQDRPQATDWSDGSSGPADAAFLVERVPCRLLLALVQFFQVGVADVAEARSPRAVLAPVHAAPHVQLVPRPALAEAANRAELPPGAGGDLTGELGHEPIEKRR